ncbi:hypothetical protein CLAIMM_02319 [Cladophialophora immunda]|nr:hypothetical protein CLAIMM_02319 [Cladophialophora immunda]
MDHIPCAEDFTHPEIPLFVDEDVEVSVTTSELEGFPRRHGWNAESFMSLDFTSRAHGRSETDIATLIQLWLYFGVLSAALDVTVNIRDFCLETPTGPKLHTAHLSVLVCRFLKRGQSLSKAHKIRMVSSLCEATKLQGRLLAGLVDGSEASPMLLQLGHSLTVLGCTLEFAVPQMMSRAMVASDIREGSIRLWAEQWSTGRLLKQLFTERGWCPSDLPRLSRLVSVNALCYAVTIRRKEMVDHGRCSEQECAVNNVDRNTYRTRHLEPECHCPQIEDTGQAACKILAQGSYPLVSLESLTNESARVRLIPYRSGTRYTAISHVWSDGMGNLEANSVTTCRLRHFANLLPNFADTKLLWIDTLCVPLDTQYRKTAIMLMTQTYERAAQVLVVDSELRGTTYTDRPVYEAFARIAASGWMRRVWTLQEGVLASRLFAEFRDGVMDVTSAVSKVNEETNASRFELNMVPIEFMLVVGLLQSIRRARDRSCEFFINVWNAMRLRRTSWRGDEIICFAQMLGLPVKEILAVEGHEQRMMTCLSMLDHVPLGLLFTYGPKLTIQGYRWAPRSFLQEERIDPTFTPVPRDDRGLRLTCCGIFLDQFAGLGRDGNAYYWDEDDLVLNVRVGGGWQGTEMAGKLLGSKLAILIDGAPRAASRDMFGMVQGALVTVQEAEDNWGVPCQYECGVDWGTMLKTDVTQEVSGKCTRTDDKINWHLG